VSHTFKSHEMRKSGTSALFIIIESLTKFWHKTIPRLKDNSKTIPKHWSDVASVHWRFVFSSGRIAAVLLPQMMVSQSTV